MRPRVTRPRRRPRPRTDVSPGSLVCPIPFAYMLRERYTTTTCTKCKAGARHSRAWTPAFVVAARRASARHHVTRATARGLVVLRFRHDGGELLRRERVGQPRPRAVLHVCGNRDVRLSDVVPVIALGEHVTEPIGVARPGVIAGAADKRRVHGDAQDVLARRDGRGRLVEHEELPV